MSSREDIAEFQVRMAKGESERDSLRGSGRQEKYLEAYSMVEALELQLDQLRKAPVQRARRPSAAAAAARYAVSWLRSILRLMCSPAVITG
jgi:hypothetical protein